jgi:hypothetical protein
MTFDENRSTSSHGYTVTSTVRPLPAEQTQTHRKSRRVACICVCSPKNVAREN